VKRDVSIAVVTAVLVAGIAFGLTRMRGDVPLTPSSPFSGKTTSAGSAKKTGKIVMHVNGEPITEDEFAAFIQQQVPAEMQAYFGGSPEGRQRAAEELAKLVALAQEGRRLGAEKDPKAQTAVAWAAMGAHARFALEKLSGDASDAALRAEYEKMKANPSAAEWSHIMIAYKGGQAPPRKQPVLSLEQAKAKAQTLADRIRAGADFADVARAESDDPNSFENGGRMPGVTAQSLPEPVRGLKMGEISAPVTTPYGVHIFRQALTPFAAVRPQLAQKLQADRMQSEAERLGKAAKVEKDPAFFGKPAAPPAPMPVAPPS
jgi:hypothetical protein